MKTQDNNTATAVRSPLWNDTTIKILDRYVLKEMLSPFLISLFAFVVMFIGRVLFDNMSWLIEVKAALPQVVRLVVYQIPWVLGTSMPLAVLFAAAISVNRLGHDSEITAIRMAGVPIRRIFLSVFIVGLLASALTFWLGESVTPWANREAARTKRYIAGQQSVPLIPENVFFNVDGYYFYVHRAERHDGAHYKLHNLLIYETPAPGGYPRLITAAWAANKSNVWTLHDGVMHQVGSDGFTQFEAKFPEMELNLGKSLQYIWDAQQTTEEMGFRELQHKMSMYKGVGQEITRMKVDWHFKLSDPLSCLIYVLCAVPLSLRFSKVGSYSGILLGIIIYFLYWNNTLLGKYFGMGGLVPPVVAGWSQSVVFGAIGLYLLRREE
jgi:lipopolysaccharide export system permease protein